MNDDQSRLNSLSDTTRHGSFSSAYYETLGTCIKEKNQYMKMNNAAFFLIHFKIPSPRRIQQPRKQLNPRRLQNHQMLPNTRRQNSKREGETRNGYFHPSKALLRASIIFQKESYLVVHQYSILNSANPYSRIPFSLSDQCILFYCFFF